METNSTDAPSNVTVRPNSDPQFTKAWYTVASVRIFGKQEVSDTELRPKHVDIVHNVH